MTNFTGANDLGAPKRPAKPLSGVHRHPHGAKVAAVLVVIVLFSLTFAALEVRIGAVPLDSGGITSLDFGE
jgi:hypothetical protein